ncbi:hypothetical protein KC946_01860 [Candidatus Saccharibacteria bacterium]|nr:hypothetical protein [Candidatus Saccharibacteria bacterium]
MNYKIETSLMPSGLLNWGTFAETSSDNAYSNYYYGQESYGTSSYNGEVTQQSNSFDLTNTGTRITLGVSVIALIVFIIAATRLIKNLRRN